MKEIVISSIIGTVVTLIVAVGLNFVLFHPINYLIHLDRANWNQQKLVPGTYVVEEMCNGDIVKVNLEITQLNFKKFFSTITVKINNGPAQDITELWDLYVPVCGQDVLVGQVWWVTPSETRIKLAPETEFKAEGDAVRRFPFLHLLNPLCQRFKSFKFFINGTKSIFPEERFCHINPKLLEDIFW